MAKQKKKQASGGARLIAAGKKPILLGLQPAEHAAIKKAAASKHQSLTEFVSHHALAAASRILRRQNG